MIDFTDFPQDKRSVTFKKNTSAFIISENWFLVAAGQLIALTGRHAW